MKRELFYLSLAAAGFTHPSAVSAGEKPKQKPNVIIIFADDLGWAELGCYGNTFNETPALDSLARCGVRFTDAYASAPISSPSRAGLISGRYPLRDGITDYIKPNSPIHLDPSRAALPEALRRNGYRTGIIGKWHLSGYRANGAPVERHPDEYGFEEVILSAEESIGNGSYFYPWHHLKSVTEAEKTVFIVERMNREALGFIERNSDRPFFLYLSHYAVHTMVHGQPELVDYFRSKPGCSHSAPSKNNPENDPDKKWPADYLAKPHNPHLAAQLKVIDDGVGMIVEKLEELGIADKTIVIFTSDNGGSPQVTDNGPLRGGKGTLYEGGTREPMIVWQPGRICGGRVSELPTNNYDFYPTLCQLTGTPLPEGFEPDGTSIADELLGTGKCDAERPLYWYFKIQGRKNGGRWCSSVRAGDWKLIEFHDTGEKELYNLREDPGETRNRIGDAPERAERLAEQLADWRREAGREAPQPRFLHKKTFVMYIKQFKQFQWLFWVAAVSIAVSCAKSSAPEEENPVPPAPVLRSFDLGRVDSLNKVCNYASSVVSGEDGSMKILLLRDDESIDITPEDSEIRPESRGQGTLLPIFQAGGGEPDAILGSDIPMPYNPPLRRMEEGLDAQYSLYRQQPHGRRRGTSSENPERHGNRQCQYRRNLSRRMVAPEPLEQLPGHEMLPLHLRGGQGRLDGVRSESAG